MPEAHLSIKVVPGARRDQIVGRYGDGLKVRVSAPPEGGRANEAVAALLAGALGVPVRQVAVLRGHTSPRKTLRIAGFDQAQIDAWLAHFT